MNVTMLIGVLVKDPQKVELDGKSLCKLNIAVSENFTKDGERPSQFFNVAVWNKMADICLKYLKKGSKIAVIGKIQNRSWEDKDGVKHYANEIVASEIEFLSTPKNKAPKDTTPVNDDKFPF